MKMGALMSAMERSNSSTEPGVPDAATCLRRAREARAVGDLDSALQWAVRVVDAGDQFPSWQSAAALIDKLGSPARARRSARLALLGSYTSVQLAPLLRLAGLRAGVDLEIYECPYGQYRQEILNPESSMYLFSPDVILLAVHEGEVRLPEFSDSPDADIAAELERWTSLWALIGERSRATVVQHNFVVPDELPMGHFGARLRGTRYRMLQRLNQEIADSAPPSVAIVDCDRVAASFGKRNWHDPRYWYFSRQAVSLGALPALARETAAVLGGALGLGRKCLVLDLDNTLWGGVIGEDRVEGIRLGEGREGEAFADFQQYIRELKNRGIVLAVCSKNNEADAREAFERHTGMRLRLDDFAAFVANWESKPDNLRAIAKTLDLGLDALVFVDDNPAERHYVRQELPEVEVIELPGDPALYRRTLANCLLFESNSFTAEDRARSDQYRARAQAAVVRSSAGSLEEYCLGLEMQATIRPFQPADLERLTQLINKTNQFNLTTRRYTSAEASRS
jgi:FkbH-like protein